jgi:hypothetical protein
MAEMHLQIPNQRSTVTDYNMAKIKFRRDTSSNWTLANPILAQGEPGFEYDTGKLKIGDGNTVWNDLSYIESEGSGPSISNGDTNVSIPESGGDVVINLDDNNSVFRFTVDGTIDLPEGGKIREDIVTDNPTIELIPAEPEAESQKLIVKGGGPVYSNTENNITISTSSLTVAQGDVAFFSVDAPLYAGETFYWWVDNFSPGSRFDPDNGEITLDEFGYASISFTVLDDSVPLKIYVADTLYNAYLNNKGAGSVLVNEESGEEEVPDLYHLHLTTGDLTETSIFLGTDEHNVRTKIDGSVEITSYDYENDETYRLNFKNNKLRISSTANEGDEDLYIKAEDDLYLDAEDDDVIIRSNDDTRIRSGYDFVNDSFTYEWRFTDTGEMIFYNDVSGYEYGYIRQIIDFESSLRTLEIEGDQQVIIKATTNDVWKFDNNGNLTLPNNAGKINSSVSDGGGLQVEAELDFEIKVNDGEGGSAIWSFAGSDITFPDSTIQTTAYTGDSDRLVNEDLELVLNPAGILEFPEADFTEGSEILPGIGFPVPESQGGFVGVTANGLGIIVNGDLWEFRPETGFSTQGLYLPNGGIIAEADIGGIYTIELTPANPDDTSQKLVIKGGGPEEEYHLHLTTGNLTTTSIFLGTDEHNVRTEQNGAITINTRDYSTEETRNWTFDKTGGLTFPDNTVQTTAFTSSPTLNVLKIDDGVHEKFQAKSAATGTVEHDCSLGHIFYHTNPDTNWTANLTNLNLNTGYATTVSIVIVQGGTGYYPNTLQINGSNQTINWQGNATPTPSTTRTDVVTFSIINNNGTYTVLGQLTGF